MVCNYEINCLIMELYLYLFGIYLVTFPNTGFESNSCPTLAVPCCQSKPSNTNKSRTHLEMIPVLNVRIVQSLKRLSLGADGFCSYCVCIVCISKLYCTTTTSSRTTRRCQCLTRRKHKHRRSLHAHKVSTTLGAGDGGVHKL